MKKVIFSILTHSFIDVITNSSSELFVGKANTKKQMEDMIKELYPEYLTEYEPLRNIDEISDDEFEMYLDYAYSTWDNKTSLSDKFLILPEVLYVNWADRETEKYWYGELSKEGIKLIKEELDPKKKMFFLFSIDDNPNWDMQEELMGIMERYHLG